MTLIATGALRTTSSSNRAPRFPRGRAGTSADPQHEDHAEASHSHTVSTSLCPMRGRKPPRPGQMVGRRWRRLTTTEAACSATGRRERSSFPSGPPPDLLALAASQKIEVVGRKARGTRRRGQTDSERRSVCGSAQRRAVIHVFTGGEPSCGGLSGVPTARRACGARSCAAGSSRRSSTAAATCRSARRRVGAARAPQRAASGRRARLVFPTLAGRRSTRRTCASACWPRPPKRPAPPGRSFHTFRHTCAAPFERGANVVEVQRWLGHHSPRFTLDTYVHLMPNGLGRTARPRGRVGEPRRRHCASCRKRS